VVDLYRMMPTDGFHSRAYSTDRACIVRAGQY